MVGPGAEGRGHLLEPLAAGAQRALEADHEEGQGDEGLRHHDGGGGEGDLEPEHLHRVPEQALAAERVEQRDAADHRGQHEREQDERAGDRLPPELGAREDERHRHAEEDAQHGAHQRGPQAQREGGPRGLGGDQRAEAAPLDPGEHRHQRQDDERRADRGGDEHPGGQSEPRSSGRGTWRTGQATAWRSPAAARMPLPGLAGDGLEEGLGGGGVLALLERRDRVGVDGRRGLGELDALDRVARALDVGDVDQPGVGLLGGDLAEDVGDRLLLADRLDVDLAGGLDLGRGRAARAPRGRTARP